MSTPQFPMSPMFEIVLRDAREAVADGDMDRADRSLQLMQREIEHLNRIWSDQYLRRREKDSRKRIAKFKELQKKVDAGQTENITINGIPWNEVPPYGPILEMENQRAKEALAKQARERDERRKRSAKKPDTP